MSMRVRASVFLDYDVDLKQAKEVVEEVEATLLNEIENRGVVFGVGGLEFDEIVDPSETTVEVVLDGVDEIIADLAMNMEAAHEGAKPEDSRERVNAVIGWAYEFARKHSTVDWSEQGDYIGEVDKFFEGKFVETYGVHPFKRQREKASC